ncbi:hypothetical protein [Rhizosaccharibacter radicis]|uniref:Uncharacterized protein n=1 Tax=Rhizosaccharibacter radicis TaxID=2782605 RepID=A0ABT1W0R7_9PROT|nr:hypothetical protein [Acetobacteraceae bacterium KSS12]
MPLFVIEMAGEPLLVFPEDDLALAQEELDSGNIKESLSEFHRDGEPLWDGEASLSVRAADAAETVIWQEALAEAVENEELDEDEKDEFAVFLVDTEEEE